MNAFPSYERQPKSITRGSRDGRPLFANDEISKDEQYSFQLYEYLLAFYAPHYECGLQAGVVLPSRVLLSVRDDGGMRSLFQSTVNSMWVRTMNRMSGTSGARIEPGPTDSAVLLDGAAELDALLEMVLAPVTDGIVPNARLWAGTLFTPEDAGKERVVKRPPGLNPRRFPEEVRYTVQVPQHQEGDSFELVRGRFRRKRRRAEGRLAMERRAAGVRCCGVAAALSADPRVVPASRPPKRPRQAFRSSRPELLEAALEQLRDFRIRYRNCLTLLREGVVGIVWPPGTNYHHFINGFARESGELKLSGLRAPS